MLIEQGSQKLREFTEASYQEKHTKVTDGVWPVSYTHLDVYKRQP